MCISRGASGKADCREILPFVLWEERAERMQTTPRRHRASPDHLTSLAYCERLLLTFKVCGVTGSR